MDIHRQKMAEKKGSGNEAQKPPAPPVAPAAPVAETIRQNPSAVPSPATPHAPPAVAAPPAPAVQQPAPKPAPQASQAPPAPEATDAYGRDSRERTAFDITEHKILVGTVPRIRLGQVLTSEVVEMGHVKATEAPPCTDGEQGHVPGYIWGLGKKPKGMAGGLSIVRDKPKDADHGEDSGDEMLYKILVEASKDLKTHSLPVESGPYADKEGRVAEMAEAAFAGAKEGDLFGLIERIIDMRPFMEPLSERANPRFFKSYNFHYNESVETPDELPVAGEILGQEARLAKEHVTGAGLFKLVHPMEPYILAVAALRRKGINAYPAQSIVPAGEDEEAAHPLIAILDLSKEVPLITFDMFRAHPATGAIDILSDVAVEGVTFAMLAEARVRHLVYDMIRLGEQGREMEPDEFGNQLNRISRMLFESVKRWDGNEFVSRAMTKLSMGVGEAVLISDVSRFGMVNSPQVTAQVDRTAREILTSGVDPDQIRPSDPITVQAREMAVDVYNITSNALTIVQTLLGAWITKANEANEGQKQG